MVHHDLAEAVTTQFGGFLFCYTDGMEKRQVFYIHGGESYKNYEDFIDRLQTKDIWDLPSTGIFPLLSALHFSFLFLQIVSYSDIHSIQ